MEHLKISSGEGKSVMAAMWPIARDSGANVADSARCSEPDLQKANYLRANLTSWAEAGSVGTLNRPHSFAEA